MIPIGDDNSTLRHKAVIVPTIAMLCVLAFIAQWLLGETFSFTWSCTPWELWHRADLDAPVRLTIGPEHHILPHGPLPDARLLWLTPITAMFLHGDLLHLIGNLLYLVVFGDQIEDRLGRTRFLLFYLCCGVLAAAAHFVSDPDSVIPMLGASGAISGVLGAYCRYFPWNRVTVLVPILIIPLLLPMPAIIPLGLWFVGQWVSLTAGQPGVAWLAHIGGFIAGFVLIRKLDKSR